MLSITRLLAVVDSTGVVRENGWSIPMVWLGEWAGQFHFVVRGNGWSIPLVWSEELVGHFHWCGQI